MAKNNSRKRTMRRKRGGNNNANKVNPGPVNANAGPVNAKKEETVNLSPVNAAPANVAPAAAPANVAPAAVNNAAAPSGGKRKTRKVSKGASDWNKKVMEVYHELKKKNPATKLGDAMRECSKRKKRGDL